MSNKHKSHASAGRTPAGYTPTVHTPTVGIWIIAAAGIAALVAHLALSLNHSNWYWGINHCFWLGRGWTAGLVAAGCLLCLPPVWAALGRAAARLGRGGIRVRHHPLNDVVIAGLAAIAFWLLRSPHHFLGDGRLMVRMLEQGNWFHATEFLDRWLHHVVLEATRQTLNWDAATVYAVLSVAAGFVYTLAALRLGTLLRQKVFVAAALLTLGTVQLFLGYAESYSLATAAILIYVLLALEYLAGRRAFIWVGLSLLVGVALHNALLFLAPSYFYLVVAGREKDSTGFAGRALQGIGWLALTGLMIFLTSRQWKAGESPLMLLPVLRDPLGQYTLFSWKHLVDFLNEQILISPLAWIGAVIFLAAFWKDHSLRASRRFGFLLVAGAVALAFSLVIRPRLGGSRDWDLWSMGSLPYVVGAVCWIASGLAKRRDLRFAAYILVVVGAFHVVPWFAVNKSAGLSLDRFDRMADANPLWPRDRIASAQSEIGHFYLEQDEPAEAIRHIEQATVADPRTGRYWDALGVAYIDLGLFAEAEAPLRKAIELDPKDSSAYNNLGRAYFMLRRLDEAESVLKRALTLDPQSGPIYFNLGKVFAARGEIDPAIEAYGQATRVWPFVPEYWRALAGVLAQVGRAGEAAEALNRAGSLEQ
jgi:tetratricopeptide (TPR) repeat protein